MRPDSGKPMLPSRRQFLATSASLAGGLVIACFVPFGARRLFAQEGGPPPAPPMDPNAFVHIGSDDSVTVVLKHSEMGQGVWTSIPMVVAEELDCDWSKVRVENAPNAQVYANNAFGIQGTGGSTSTLESFDQMRKAGAMARAMLVEAAAQQWKVDPRPAAPKRVVSSRARTSARYGELADAAAKLKAPDKVALKDPSKWTLIGKPTPRLDSLAKVTGTAGFGIDVQRPRPAGRLSSRARRCSVARSSRSTRRRQRRWTASSTWSRCRAASPCSAKHFWAAKKGREALVIDWDNGAGASLSTVVDARRLPQARRRRADWSPSRRVMSTPSSKAADKRIEADYEVPFLAHAPMEPLNCTVEIGKDGCEIWTGTQFQGVDQGVAAQILGIEIRAGEDPHAVSRRRLRSPRQPALGFHRRGRAGGQGREQAGQDRLDARRRHPRRLLPADVAVAFLAPRSARTASRQRGRTRSSASRSSPARRSRR